ncbi:porin [Vibrio rarus]|uniref:porin n=1 Tax=Vibrio rarus TaxID=413403 RepID=UPI0021C2C062|nr:porin [Vibrio rarus]
MKTLTLTTIAIASVFAASANAHEIYKGDALSLSVGGRVEARSEFSDQGKDKSIQKQDDISRARLNIQARTQITDDVFARGYVEKEFTKTESNETRYLYVAVGNDNNEVQFGKTDGALYQIVNYTDILNTYGAEASNAETTAYRADNQFLYIGSYDALTVNASFNGGGQGVKDNVGNTTTAHYGYALSASYDFGFLNAGAGYAKEIHNGTFKDSDSMLLSLGSNITDSLYVGGLYVNGTKFGDDFNGYELASSYAFTDKLSLAGTFTSVKFDSQSDNSTKAALDLGYQATEYFKTYVGVSKAFTLNEELKGMLGAKVTF